MCFPKNKHIISVIGPVFIGHRRITMFLGTWGSCHTQAVVTFCCFHHWCDSAAAAEAVLHFPSPLHGPRVILPLIGHFIYSYNEQNLLYDNIHIRSRLSNTFTLSYTFMPSLRKKGNL